LSIPRPPLARGCPATWLPHRIALPLKDQNAKVFGALNFYSTEEMHSFGRKTAPGRACRRPGVRDHGPAHTGRTRSVGRGVAASEEQYRRFVEDDVAGCSSQRRTPCAHLQSRVRADAGLRLGERCAHNECGDIYQDPAARAAVLAELRAQRRIDHVEMAWQRRDGLPVAAIVTMIGEFDDKGELVRNRGYVIDNTSADGSRSNCSSRRRWRRSAVSPRVAHDFNNSSRRSTATPSCWRPTCRRRQTLAGRPGDSQGRHSGRLLTRQLLASAAVRFCSRRPRSQRSRRGHRADAEAAHRRADRSGRVARAGSRSRSGDPFPARTVLLNLVVNARDAMPAGELTIETADVEMDDEYVRAHPSVSAGSYVQLAVSDTGIGMSADTMEHLFEPSLQRACGRGHGLGLATVRDRGQSGGHVAACSQPGCGAAFSVYLPRVPETLKLGGRSQQHRPGGFGDDPPR